jgi:thioredoxin-related protein
MSRNPRLPVLFFAAALALTESSVAQVPEPPLPEPDNHSARPAFDLLVPPRQADGDAIPEDLPGALPTDEFPAGGLPHEDPINMEDPIQPAPEGENLQLLQDIDAPGAPSDGEPLPEIPHVPGLVLPKFRPAPTLAPGAAPSPLLPNGIPAPDLLPAPGFQLAAKSRWIKSPYEASRIAREEQKPLLIFFAQLLNGSGPTAHLNDDLIVLDEFNQFASARLVLTKLQYPTGSPGKNYTEGKLAVLNMVKEKFKIRGFPAIVLLDDKGHEIERISGYARVKDNNGVIYSSAHTILERLKEAEKRFSERRTYRQERIDRLTAQGYRTWYSTTGTSLLAKMVRAEPHQIILMDENSAWRTVRPDQLKLYDAEWARRKQAGLLPDPEAKKVTAAADGPPKP